MPWHRQAYDWTAEKLAAMSPRARWLGVVLVLLVGLVLLLTSSTRPSPKTEFLFGGRTCSLAEIAVMESALARAGLSESAVEGNRIRVPSEHKNDYLKALADAAVLPGGIELDWDAYVPDSPFPSRELVEQKSRHAHQQKLARIIQAMHGIESATVNYDEMKKAGFPPTVEKRAVVVVRAGDSRHLTFDEIEAIRATVTGYVSGLDRRQVTVTDLNAVRAYPGDVDSRIDGQQYTTAAWMLEKAYREKILRRLEMYPGVVVGVNVQMPRAELPLAASATTLPATIAAEATPALLTASIDIPRTYFQRVWRDRNPQAIADPNAAEMQTLEHDVTKSVQRAVSALLPPPAPEWAAFEQVTVTTFDDLDHPTASIASATSPAAAPPVAPPWLMLLGGIAIVLLAVLMRLTRAPDRGSRPNEFQIEPTIRSVSLAEPSDQAAVADLPHKTAANWQHELAKAVQHDPDAAAKALQRWMKNAA